MKKNTNNHAIHVFIATLLIALPNVLLADSVIYNNISVSSNTGGNTVNGGEIVTKDATSEVHVKTTINNEVVTDIHETAEAGGIHIEELVHQNHNGTIEKTIYIEKESSGNAKTDEENSSQKDTTHLTTENSMISNTDTNTHVLGVMYLASYIITSHSKTYAYVLSHLF